MKRLIVVLTVLSLALAPAALGDFHTPPHTNPDIDWETAPPYQRNMTLDFTENPVGPSASGIPGAKYIGYDDPKLWDSDFVELTGDVIWMPDLRAVGIFNGPPIEMGKMGEIIIHFDNWDRDWAVKHMYVEYTYEATDSTDAFSAQESLHLPDGYSLVDSWSNTTGLSPGQTRVQFWAEIEPNPPWEELVIDLGIMAHPDVGAIYLTDLQIATECVPVPGATLLALLGLTAAGTKLRRFV